MGLALPSREDGSLQRTPPKFRAAATPGEITVVTEVSSQC
jgi:hypothetical protein